MGIISGTQSLEWLTGVAHLLARPILEIVADLSFERGDQLPVPSADPVVHAAGTDADRILLIGTAPVRGIGVTSNELGLGGQLARRLAALTGRGVDVELAGSATLTADRAAALLRGYDLSRFDAVILMLGGREAVGLQPTVKWARSVTRLIQAASVVPQVFVVGVPDFTPQSTLPPMLARATVRRIAALNEETRTIAAESPGVQFVPFPAVTAPTLGFGAALYARWARALAPPIALGLDPLLHRIRVPERVDETVRQRALDRLGVIGSDRDERIDSITRAARDLLGASGASVTFLDGDRQWIKSAVSISPWDTARFSSFCNSTIAAPRLFVVEDASTVDGFAGHPWVIGKDRVRFYAGYPIEAPGGARVGALCVVDTEPRHLRDAEAALLRELALQVQAVLWENVIPTR